LQRELIREIISGFIGTSSQCILELAKHLARSERTASAGLFTFVDGRRRTAHYSNRFLLRASTEYSNPQLTLEDLQGILTVRILEACVNYALEGEREVKAEDVGEVAKGLEGPPKGAIVPFLMNTDDVEPDRYSVNPLRESIVTSGKSALPAYNLTTEGLRMDEAFLKKYMGILISPEEVSRIQYHLENVDRYVDAIDAMKYEQLHWLSDQLGIQLVIPALRMPLETLTSEGEGGAVHQLIRQTHSDYGTISLIYELMGRSITKRKTLLPVVPHSSKGVGSKRAAAGKLIFENMDFRGIKVSYRPTLLYPNDVDEGDVSIAKACEDLSVDAQDILQYDFKRTPASPQFALYSILSPEAVAVWHGIGIHQGSEIVKSYVSIHSAHDQGSIFPSIPKPFKGIPLQLDLVAERMLRHPIHHNIDASVGTVDLAELLKKPTAVRVLKVDEFLRKPATKQSRDK
jgi:hypothetical protein